VTSDYTYFTSALTFLSPYQAKVKHLQDANQQAAAAAAAQAAHNKIEADKAKVEAEASAEVKVHRKAEHAEALRKELATALAATQAAQEELAKERKSRLLEADVIHDRGVENQPVNNVEDHRLMTKFFALRNSNATKS